MAKEDFVITDDERRSLDSALPAMIDAQKKLQEMLQKNEGGWVRVMFQVSSGRVLKSTVETQTGYPGVTKQVDENQEKG